MLMEELCFHVDFELRSAERGREIYILEKAPNNLHCSWKEKEDGVFEGRLGLGLLMAVLGPISGHSWDNLFSCHLTSIRPAAVPPYFLEQISTCYRSF